MKKLFIGIAATALAAAMCVSFAACGETPSATDAKDVQGYEVTAEQWNAAFEAFTIEALTKEDAEFTITETTSYTYTLKPMTDPETNEELNGGYTLKDEIVYIKKGDKEHGINTRIRKFTGDGLRMSALTQIPGALPSADATTTPDKSPVQETTTTTAEGYTERTADGYWTYEQKDGKWMKMRGGNSFASYFDYVFIYGNFKTQCENYTYSEANKGYIPKDYSAEDSDLLTVIKFDRDGKLIAIYAERYEEYPGSTESLTTGLVIEYSAKEITLPTVEEE